MKKYIYSVFAIVVLLALSAGPLHSEEKNDEARFQLFNAEYNSALIQRSKTTAFGEKKLFKIDTITGKTWMLIDFFQEGKDIKYWREIKNTPDK